MNGADAGDVLSLTPRVRRQLEWMALFGRTDDAALMGGLVARLDSLDAKSGALLQFIGVLGAVAALLSGRNASLGAVESSALMLIAAPLLLAAGAFALSSVRIFDMTNSVLKRANASSLAEPDNLNLQRAALLCLAEVFIARRDRFRAALFLTWLGFMSVMALLIVVGAGQVVPLDTGTFR